MQHPIQIARDVFCKTVERCLGADEDTYLLELKHLSELAYGNSQIQRCIEELLLEVTNWANDHIAKNKSLFDDILNLRDQVVQTIPGIERLSETDDLVLNPTISHFDKLASEERSLGIPLWPDQGVDYSLEATLIRVLAQIVTKHYSDCDRIPAQLWDAQEHLTERAQWLYRERMNFCRLHPGVVWWQIMDAVRKINPVPEPSHSPLDLDELMREVIQGIRFEKVLYGWRSMYGNISPSKEERGRYLSWKVEIDKGLCRLSSEIEIRLATRASSEWAIRRYAARSGITGMSTFDQ